MPYGDSGGGGTGGGTLDPINPFTLLGNNTAIAAIPAAIKFPIIGVGNYATAGANAYQVNNSVPTFFQHSLQNLSTDPNASTDFVVTADNGNDTTHYANFGINSSAGGSAPFTAGNTAYLYTTDDLLYLAALSPLGSVHLVAGGPDNVIATANFSQFVIWVPSSLNKAAVQLNGVINSGGTSLGTVPHFLIQPMGATTVNTWSTGGTAIGVNATDGFTGDLISLSHTGLAARFKVSAAGTVTATGTASFAGSPAISTSALLLSGTIQTGGTSTTNFPLFFIQPTGATAVNTWIPGGTAIGINTAVGFAGNFIDCHINGGATLFRVTNSGVAVASGGMQSATFSATQQFNSTWNQPPTVAVFQATGTICNTGTAVTNLPQWFAQTGTAVAVASWATGGTYFGVNADLGFSGNFIDCHTNGGATLFKVTSNGAILSTNLISGQNFSATGQILCGGNGAASIAIMLVTGIPYAAGNGTTTFPHWFTQNAAATPVTTWNTAGTFFGINANGTFAGNFLDFHLNGGTSLFLVSSTGAVATAAPAGGTSGKWKLGAVAAATVALDTTKYAQIEVDGVALKVALCA